MTLYLQQNNKINSINSTGSIPEPYEVHDSFDSDMIPATPTTNENFLVDASDDCSKQCPMVSKKIRPSSNYVNKSQKPETTRRNKLQLLLIEEVNKTNNYSDTCSSSQDLTELSVSTTTSDCGVAQEDGSEPVTRARKVPMTQMLPVFNRDFKNQDEVLYSKTPKASYGRQSENQISNRTLKSTNSQSQLFKVSQNQNLLTKNSSDEQSEGSTGGSTIKQHIQINTEINNASSSAAKTSPPGASQQMPTNMGFAQAERQIKYLGLVIEKDEEYHIERDPTDPQSEILVPFDPIKRSYMPIRDRYIYIVKNSRKLCIDSFEKRGRKDFKRTSKNMNKIAKHLAKYNQQNQDI